MKLSRVLRISRPRFWIYELGPYMIGILAALFVHQHIMQDPTIDGLTVMQLFSTKKIVIILFAIYFLVPANIWIYGINDIYDYETDKLNPKKVEGYEALVEPKEQKSLWKWILGSNFPFLLLVGAVSYTIFITTGGGCAQEQLNCQSFSNSQITIHRGFILSFLAFLFFSGQYSAKPIRAKARPILDSFFSAGHYIATAVFGYLLVNPTGDINRYYVTAGIARAMAMHAFSAVPDIQADKDAQLATIATFLGGKATIWTCFGLYFSAAILSYSFLGRVSILLGVIYCSLMLLAITYYGNEKKIFMLYKRFPWINTISGMLLFFVVLLKII